MLNAGYFRQPTIAGDTVVFVCEDDLWSVPAQGGTALRLTSNLGDVSRPALSRDGKHLAFTSLEEGHPEVYCMPAGGGPAQRITYLGADSQVRDWTPDGKILFVSTAGQAFAKVYRPHTVAPEGGPSHVLPWGPANDVGFAPGNGGVVLGRNTADPARWKRYRGGTAGKLWVDPKGSGDFRPLMAELNGNLASPLWVGGRIYFLSDHEGVGNLYSCTPEGSDLQRHTDHNEYYARLASTDGQRIV
ncbi:MAG: PD40 domain-containing protein, partial [Candidatus Omnitrophica bacterium]|nr:PD40 domain-containing protein [Candidatus Omnitrophota bacterium]